MDLMKTPRNIMPAVAAVIFNQQREVLLQRRRDVGQWCIVSGHMEFGETLEEAIVREVREETQANPELVRFIGIYSSPETQTYVYDKRIVHYVTACFEMRLTAPLAEGFSNEETRELKFFQPECLPKDLALINPHWLADALDQSGKVFVR